MLFDPLQSLGVWTMGERKAHLAVVGNAISPSAADALSPRVEAEMATVHFDAAGLARRYGWDVRSLYNLRARGGDLPPAILVSGRPRWRLSDVIAWENAHLETPNTSK